MVRYYGFLSLGKTTATEVRAVCNNRDGKENSSLDHQEGDVSAITEVIPPLKCVQCRG